MNVTDAITDLVRNLHEKPVDDAEAFRRVRRFVADRVPDGCWFHERTAAGWDVRDENRLLVAHVPDAEHEREDDAVQIVSSARRADHYGRLCDALRGVTRGLEETIETRRATVRDLVARIAKDSQRMTATLAERGPDPVSSTWVSTHVRELVEAQEDLEQLRRHLRALQEAMEDA